MVKYRVNSSIASPCTQKTKRRDAWQAASRNTMNKDSLGNTFFQGHFLLFPRYAPLAIPVDIICLLCLRVRLVHHSQERYLLLELSSTFCPHLLGKAVTPLMSYFCQGARLWDDAAADSRTRHPVPLSSPPGGLGNQSQLKRKDRLLPPPLHP